MSGTEGRELRPSGEGVGRVAISLAQLGADDLRAQDRLVEVELAVQLLHAGRLGLQVDDRVDALDMLVDLVGEAATAPDVDLLHRSAAVADHAEKLVEGRSNGPFLEIRVED